MDALAVDLGPGLCLRPIRDDDLPFLAALYASTRERELAPVPWTASEKQAFLSSQFSCQHQHYQQHYPGARFDIIEHDAQPLGRLYLAPVDGELRIMDIALVPGAQRRGIGTRLLRAVLERARSEGKEVTIHVERDNPALALYERLGFQLREDRGVYLFLVHPAAPPAASPPASPPCTPAAVPAHGSISA